MERERRGGEEGEGGIGGWKVRGRRGGAGAG